MKVIACRDLGDDCNALMKGRNLDEAVDATIKHAVSRHGKDVKLFQTAEARAVIAAQVKELDPK